HRADTAGGWYRQLHGAGQFGARDIEFERADEIEDILVGHRDRQVIKGDGLDRHRRVAVQPAGTEADGDAVGIGDDRAVLADLHDIADDRIGHAHLDAVLAEAVDDGDGRHPRTDRAHHAVGI